MYCMVCGEEGGHGNLPCPRLQGGPFRAPEYMPNPSPLPEGARPVRYVDYSDKLDRIIDLLEQIRDNTMS